MTWTQHLERTTRSHYQSAKAGIKRGKSGTLTETKETPYKETVEIAYKLQEGVGELTPAIQKGGIEISRFWKATLGQASNERVRPKVLWWSESASSTH